MINSHHDCIKLKSESQKDKPFFCTRQETKGIYEMTVIQDSNVRSR